MLAVVDQAPALDTGAIGLPDGGFVLVARYLLVMPPRLHRLVQALHAGDSVDHAAVFREHASQLL
jgi:hypothetical protein